MKSILVTGGAGYIGSHTAKRLRQAGFLPVTLDNLSSGHRSAVKWGPFVHGDIADGELTRQIIRRYRIQAVLHFAAHASVAESMNVPRKYFDNNVVSAIRLLEVLLECAVKHVIFSSTCATYGVPNLVPISELHSQRPVNPYGESKLMIERTLHWYGTAYGLKAVSLRYFNAAGADPDGEIGEVHSPETHLIPLAISAALGLRDGIDVCGTDYPTSDGTAIRDYTHVSDIAEAHVLALRYLLDGSPSIALNLGTGHGYSVLDIVRTVERVSGVAVPVGYRCRRPGDPAELIADSSKAAAVLGWRPLWTDLAYIIRTAWDWHSSRERSSRLENIAGLKVTREFGYAL